jgi:glycosyltransferase involved in cell wall biosynthesis
MTPRVSVIISFFNSAPYLHTAIQSILSQTYSNFELILINDGSTDQSAEIVNSFSDSRITLIENKQNEGLSASLNTGIRCSRGEYIARQDADDYSLPDRLKQQVNYLDTHLDVGVLACRTWDADASGIPVYCRREPVTHHEISISLHHAVNPLMHGSIMMRRDVLARLPEIYRFRAGQDYDLWLRLIDSCQFAKLAEPLYIYRNNPQTTSLRVKELRREMTLYMLQLYKERCMNGGVERSDWRIYEQAVRERFRNAQASRFSLRDTFLLPLLHGKTAQLLTNVKKQRSAAMIIVCLLSCIKPAVWLLRVIYSRYRGGLQYYTQSTVLAGKKAGPQFSQPNSDIT